MIVFLGMRLRWDDGTVAPQPETSATQKQSDSIETPITQAVESEVVLFNLNGEWRGVLQPVHGVHLDPRDWNLDLKLTIYADKVQVFIRRGNAYQEVKAGHFRIIKHKTSNSLRIQVYEAAKSSFATKDIPFEHCWERQK